jgi:hypothetical protein
MAAAAAGNNNGQLVYSAAANRQPKLTHKQIYDMVNAMTNRKPVRIDKNDNIFLLDNISGNNNNNNASNNKSRANPKKQNVQINDVRKTNK